MIENKIEKIDRHQAKIDAERESKEADLKQHADKLVQGFGKIDAASAIRAIWELVQNACDLSPSCNVTIDYSKNGFSFSHNGKPFTTSTLLSLIKQVSNKGGGPEVGKFGTGFITTHAFGRKYILNSILDVNGQFIEIKDFVIDRSPKEWKSMVDNLIVQEEQVYNLLENGALIQEQECLTTFTYLPATEIEKGAIRDSLDNLDTYIPIVLTLNKRLSSVTVIDFLGKKTIYQKKSKGIEDGIYRTTLNINDTEKVVCSLRNIEEGIEIILPVNKNKIAFSFKENIARLFLCFPLIGTEHWGFNYIIHSSKFDPTEPRDGIHLKSKNEQVQESEAANRDLIQKASAMVFEFVNSFSNNVYLPLNLATINFNVSSDKPLLNEYFQGLKTEWINQFQHFPLVETEGGNIKPSEVCFLHQDLLQDDESFDAVFKIANQFWKNIPKKDLIKKWTKIIDEWSIESIKYITIEDVVGKIQEAANLSAFEEQEHLKKFYSYLITIGQVDVFNTHKLLPNIKGEFRKLVELNNSLNLPQVLIGIADIILPDIPKRHVHPDFKFNLEFAPYTRKNYTTEINDHIAKILAPIATSNLILDPNILPKLLEYCKIFSSSDSSSVPSKMIKLICKYYNHSDLLIGIPEIKEDILDVRSPQKRVLKLFLNDISKKDSEWVTENLTFLEEVISTGANYNDYMDLFQTLAVFPNQLNELRIQTKLDVDDNIPEEIKNLYDEVTVPDFPIRADLVHDKFTEYLKDKKKKTVRSLTEKIESNFFDGASYDSINEHPYKKEILKIIEEIKRNSDYEKYFPLIFSKRSGILVGLADGEDTFSILSLEASRIKKLAELGNNPDFDKIVKLGEEALLNQQQDDASFKHKHTIGIHIEMILRKALITIISENITAEIKNEQDGQDIIIKINGEAVYYIEVKSRWVNTTPFRMSKNQTLRADEQKERYALCSVDMTKYTGDNKFGVEDINEIVHCIKFNKEIGHEVVHLVDILNQTNEPDKVRLDGDYRTLIPMRIIEKGTSLSEFENYLTQLLSK